MMPLISIIIPVYNTEKYIRRCIDSVISQTCNDWELILVDDGSTDGSGKICDEYAESDERIRVYHKTNGGVSSARNVGLDNARGVFIAFIDSDDFVEPTYLEKMYDALQRNPDCSIASCSCCKYFEGEIKPIEYDSWIFSNVRYVEPLDYADRMLLMKSQHTVWGKLFKTSVLRNVRFREGFNNEDILFALDFYPQVENDRIRTVEIPDQLYYYRYRPGSICLGEQGAFYYTQFVNNGIVWKTLKGKKQNVFEYYYKVYLKQLINIITLKLQNPSKYNCGIISLYLDLWRYNDIYARFVLSKEEYKSFVNRKYHPMLIWMKYKIFRG